MQERLTTQGRALVLNAQAHCARCNHDRTGTEHLLLALIDSRPDTIAGRSIDGLGVPRKQLSAYVIAVTGYGENPRLDNFRLSRDTEAVLDRAVRIALQHGSNDADPEHILLALCEFPESTAAAALGRAGLPLTTIQEVTRRMMGGLYVEVRYGGKPLATEPGVLELLALAVAYANHRGAPSLGEIDVENAVAYRRSIR